MKAALAGGVTILAALLIITIDSPEQDQPIDSAAMSRSTVERPRQEPAAPEAVPTVDESLPTTERPVEQQELPAPPPSELADDVRRAADAVARYRQCLRVPRDSDALEDWALTTFPYDRATAEALFQACLEVSGNFAHVRSEVAKLLADERTAAFGLETLVESLVSTAPDARDAADLRLAEAEVASLLDGTPDQELLGLSYRAALSEGVDELSRAAALLELRERLVALAQDDPSLAMSPDLQALQFMLDYEMDADLRKRANALRREERASPQESTSEPRERPR